MKISENQYYIMKKYGRFKIPIIALAIALLMIFFLKLFLDYIPTLPFAVVINLVANATVGCEDGVCDSSLGEDCSTCPEDCGSCPIPSVSAPAAGGAPMAAPVVVTETKTIPSISSDESMSVTITESDNLKIQEITMEMTNDVSNVEITVKESSKPAKASVVISADQGAVYKYLEISKKNIEDTDIEKAKIKFKVKKTWINSSGIDESTIAMNRLVNNKWDKLPTTKLSEDSNNSYYEAESSGLSVFAITGEKKLIELEYSQTIKLTRDQSSLISVLVTNVGEVDLNNLILTAFSENIQIEIKPMSLDILKSNSSAIFLISVKTSKDIYLGTYTIDFTLTSDKITKKGQIKVEVEALKIELEVEQTIRNYESLISKLMQETYKASQEGRNVTGVFENLDEAKNELDESKQLFEIRDYESAKQKLLIVKIKIEQATLELAKAARPRIIFLPIPIPRPEIAGGLTVGLGTTFALYYRRRIEKKKYRKTISDAIKIIRNRESVWQR